MCRAVMTSDSDPIEVWQPSEASCISLLIVGYNTCQAADLSHVHVQGGHDQRQRSDRGVAREWQPSESSSAWECCAWT